MKNIILFLLLLSSLFLTSCGGECPMKKELEATKIELEKANAELVELKEASDQKELVHIVLIKAKPDLTEEQTNDLLAKLNSLSDIKEVKDLDIGVPAATGDPRLNTDYTYALQVTFESEDDLAAYQKNEDHLKARESTKAYLAGPPVVLDYWAE